jgi:hypothetical protein
MFESSLTLWRVRDRGLTVEFLYGGLETYRFAAERAGMAFARELAKVARRSESLHPCERALRLLSSFVQPILDGQASWDDAKEYLDKLMWQQNAN